MDKVCEQCRSPNIWVDATAVWCVTLQTWVLDQLFDHTECTECGGETHALDLKTNITEST